MDTTSFSKRGTGGGGSLDSLQRILGHQDQRTTRRYGQPSDRYVREEALRVHQVQTEADVRPGWFAGADIIGITAGTSTPDDVIDGVERRIRHFAAEMGQNPVDSVECGR